MESFSAAITSYALYSNSSWPKITLPHMGVQGQQFRAVTGALQISLSPIVRNVRDWNEYASDNQDWVQESIALQGEVNATAESIPPMLYRRVDNVKIAESQTKDGQYSPLWQKNGGAPLDVAVVNNNLLRHEVFARLFRVMTATRSPVLSEVLDPSTLLGSDALLEYEDGHTYHPESMLVQPIYKSFGVNGSLAGDVVGTLIAVIQWDVFFQNLLHEGASPIMCVMRDTCGDVHSYQIDGPRATYLAEGDLHDPNYDYLEHAVEFERLSEQYDHDHSEDCLYSLHIYPTGVMEDSYESNAPAILTAVVVLIFLFTSFVFVMYDLLVQHRQNRVQNAAIKSNAIVSSLFPAEVRDRLFEQNADAQKGSKAPGKYKSVESAAKFRLKSYLDNDLAGGGNNGDGTNVDHTIPEMYDTKPIADLFPNTTVMFADISGFTAWSSVRDPSQVFTLLETVYRAFDMIAKRRRVFKVETVGDCYVSSLTSSLP
jgi:hypothetical protein